MKDIITISDITKDYGQGRGVFDVSLSVAEGEVFGYLGPNGAGKTTTIRQLLGFTRPDAGQCQILGMDCFSQADSIGRQLGYLAGELSFMDDMTGTRFIDFVAQMKKVKDKGLAAELMERFELNPAGKIRKMSKGMKQKIGIVCAFMNDPKVIILDEPTSGLDPLMQNRFVELVLEEKKKGKTILMSSHIFEEIEKTCDRTAIIRGGRIVAVEDMNSLTSRRKKSYTVTFATPALAVDFAKNSGLAIQSINENQVTLLVKHQPAETLRTIADANPVDLSIRTQSLEELFLHFYGEHNAKEAR